MRMGDIAVDANDNLFLATFFSHQLIIGHDTLISDTLSWGYPGMDICIAKYNEIGFPQWARKAGGIEGDYARGISIYENSNYT